MKDFVIYCKQYIYDHIDDYRGQKVYPCDLGFTLTEYPNCDGTLTYSREEAKNYLREWWDEADKYMTEKFGTEHLRCDNIKTLVGVLEQIIPDWIGKDYSGGQVREFEFI